jgi:hypothetical protein
MCIIFLCPLSFSPLFHPSRPFSLPFWSENDRLNPSTAATLTPNRVRPTERQTRNLRSAWMRIFNSNGRPPSSSFHVTNIYHSFHFRCTFVSFHSYSFVRLTDVLEAAFKTVSLFSFQIKNYFPIFAYTTVPLCKVHFDLYLCSFELPLVCTSWTSFVFSHLLFDLVCLPHIANVFLSIFLFLATWLSVLSLLRTLLALLAFKSFRQTQTDSVLHSSF